MSVLIKGLDIPKDCWECQFFGTWEDVGKFSCFLGAKVKDIDIRAIDCPLIGIPTPHGRLIDADKLFWEEVGKIKPRNDEHYKAIGEFMNMITNTPTIIEAEN